ncbi:MAG: hypothetical protein R3C18_11660 [Planctomycetaceae bacterium]
MFGFFQPTCPVGLEEKVWIEREMRRLAGLFGARRFREAKLIRQGDLDSYAGDEPALLQFLRDALQFHGETDFYHVAGQTSEQIAARFIRACCKALIKEVTSGAESPSGFSVDILAIALGGTIPLANTCLKETQWADGNNWFRWRFERLGALPAHLYGYGLAVWCWDRGERDQRFQGELRPDAREPFAKSMKFLNATADSVYFDRPVSLSVTAAEDGLTDASTSVQLDTLIELSKADTVHNSLSEQLGEMLRSDENIVVLYTLFLLREHLDIARNHIEAIGDLTISESPNLRHESLNLLADLAPDTQHLVHAALTRLQRDAEPDIHLSAIRLLSCYPNAEEDVLSPVLHYAYEAVRQASEDLDVIIEALLALGLTPDEIRDELYQYSSDRSTQLLINQCLETDSTE